MLLPSEIGYVIESCVSVSRYRIIISVENIIKQNHHPDII